jgi:hypothetical protein
LPALNLDLILYWGSLGLSALAVVLFLWLMRERRGSRTGHPEPPQAAERRAPVAPQESPADAVRRERDSRLS